MLQIPKPIYLTFYRAKFTVKIKDIQLPKANTTI